jgi:hypothetical protein
LLPRHNQHRALAGHGAPCESERGQSGLPLHVREFAKLWIARFYGNLSCKCFNLFGKHWIGGRANLISDGARSAGAGPALHCLGWPI